jgi:eukaryotic-like serine/threonine-protein kinase
MIIANINKNSVSSDVQASALKAKPVTETRLFSTLTVSSGAFSESGVKTTNQDCFGFRVPEARLCETKGIAAVIADGISNSVYGKEASHACVTGFLEDYYSTPETWSVKKSTQQILTALNSWLYMQGKNQEASHRSRVSTLSAVIIKSSTAHLVHVGDSRIHLLRKGNLDLLTSDHKTWISKKKSYLSRAMGADTHLEIDYCKEAVEKGDLFILTTDGVHEYVHEQRLKQIIQENQKKLDKAAELITREALNNNSPDNVTCLLIRVDDLSGQNRDDIYQQLTELPFPPELAEGMIIDGYRIIREIHASNRSQLYLARDPDTGLNVVLKTPSVNYEDDPAYIERFILEEWIGTRIDNPHVVKVFQPQRRRRFLYHVTEFLEGKTLRQWIYDHPNPQLEIVRTIVEQIATGLQAFHRMEMLHQDLKPENILIDNHGTVKLVDFGSTRVAGILEITSPIHQFQLLGTKNYTAPEYNRDDPGSNQSDIYSLGVITYEMLTGKLPYGDLTTNWKNRNIAGKFHYRPATDFNEKIPDWIDAMLKKAVSPNPANRYPELSEFLYDLRHPNTSLLYKDQRPLIERNPVRIWQVISAILTGVVIYLFYLLSH